MHKSGEATGEHAASIEYLKTESAYLKTNMSAAVFDAKLGSAVAPINIRVQSIEDKLKTMAANTRVQSIEDKLKTMAVQATESAKKKETCAYVLRKRPPLLRPPLLRGRLSRIERTRRVLVQ